MHVLPAILLLRKFILPAVSVSFLALFLILALHIRPSPEDFCFMNTVQEKGITGSLSYWYGFLGGRWSFFLAMGLFFSLFGQLPDLYVCLTGLVVVHLAIFISAVHICFKNIGRVYPGAVTSADALAYSVLLACSFFFITFQPGDTWFATLNFLAYTLNIIMFCAGTAFILQKGNTLWHWMIIIPAFLYAGGATEPFAITAILILAAWIITGRRSSAGSAFRRLLYTPDITKKLILACAMMALSFSISLAAPGNIARKTREDSHSGLFDRSGENMRETLLADTVRIKNVLLQKKNVIFLACMPFWLFLGCRLRQQKDTVPQPDGVLKNTVLAAGVLGVIVAVSMLPVIWFFKSLGPERTWTHISFLIAIYACVAGISAGYHFQISKRIIDILLFCGGVTALLSMTVLLIRQYPRADSFAREYDRIIEELEQNKPLPAEVLLPDPGMLPGGKLIAGEDTYYGGCLHAIIRKQQEAAK